MHSRFTISLLIIATTTLAFAQVKGSPSAPQSEGAAVVTKSQIGKALEKSAPNGIKDTALRVVSIGGEYNVGVSVVRRTRVNGNHRPTPSSITTSLKYMKSFPEVARLSLAAPWRVEKKLLILRF